MNIMNSRQYPSAAATGNEGRRALLVWRLWQMGLGWGPVGLVYTLSAWWLASLPDEQAVILHPGVLDRLIPFLPSGVWLYLSFFLLVPWAYLAASAANVVRLRSGMQLSALVCGTVFIVWPTTMAIHADIPVGISGELLAWVRAVDATHNHLPSLHGALTVLAAAALLDRSRPGRSLAAAVWGACIAASVVLVRQHLLIDLLSGMAVGAGAWLLTARGRHLYAILRRQI